MSSELVPYKAGAMSEMLAQHGRLATYDTRTREGQVAVYRAVQGADKSLDDCVGEIIAVEHIVCHQAKLIDRDTGELVDTIRTVLVAPDGTRYSTRSETVRHDLQRAAEIFMLDLPWNPPMRFKVTKTPRRNGPGGYLQLVPVILLEQAEKK